MIRLRSCFLILFISLCSANLYSQVYNFNTLGYSFLEKNDKSKWGNWSEMNPVNMMITLDTNKNRIKVYSQEIQLFNILQYQPIEENENDIIYSFSCSDNGGKACSVIILTRKKQNNRKQLYIIHKDIIIVYNIFNID